MAREHVAICQILSSIQFVLVGALHSAHIVGYLAFVVSSAVFTSTTAYFALSEYKTCKRLQAKKIPKQIESDEIRKNGN